MLNVQNNVTVTTYDDLMKAIDVSKSAPNPAAAERVAHYVADAGATNPTLQQSDQSLVIVQSVGSGALTGTPSTDLYQYLTQLGGNPESLLGSLQGGHPYALVGVANNLPWYGTSGLESSIVMATSNAPGQPTGQINGMLQPDRTGLYTPVTGSPAGPINSDLFAIVFQAAQDWPYIGDPALPYIATNIQMGGYPDVRSGYTNLNIDFDAKSLLLTNLHCVNQPFRGQDFNLVKSQLLKEFAWVSTVRLFVDNLLSPYEQNGTGAIFAVDAIYDDVRNSLPPPPAVKTGLNWLDLITDAAGILSDLNVPDAGYADAALSTATMGITIGDSFLQSPGGGTADKVTADAPDQLSAALADQQTAAVEAIDRLEPILLSDYGKLGCRYEGRWRGSELGLDLRQHARHDHRAEREHPRPVLHLADPGDLPGHHPPARLRHAIDVRDHERRDPVRVLQLEPPVRQGVVSEPISRRLPLIRRNDAVQRVAFANDVSSGPQMPTTSLTDDIYGPDAESADGAFQYAPDWWRTTYNPPGGVQCHPPNQSASWEAPSPPPPMPWDPGAPYRSSRRGCSERHLDRHPRCDCERVVHRLLIGEAGRQAATFAAHGELRGGERPGIEAGVQHGDIDLALGGRDRCQLERRPAQQEAE